MSSSRNTSLKYYCIIRLLITRSNRFNSQTTTNKILFKNRIRTNSISNIRTNNIKTKITINHQTVTTNNIQIITTNNIQIITYSTRTTLSGTKVLITSSPATRCNKLMRRKVARTKKKNNIPSYLNRKELETLTE